MVGLKGMKDGRAILRIRAAIPWFFQGEGRWEAERRGSPPLPLFFLPFNPPLVWLNSARGTGKRFFYLISLPLLGEGTGAICLLLFSLSLLLTFFFFFFLCFSCRFSSRFDKKRNWENLKWRMTFFLVLWFDSGWKNRFVFFFFFVFLSSSYLPLRFSCRFLRKKIKRIWKWFSSWFLLRFWVEESMWFVFFLSFFYLVFDVSFSVGLRKGIKRIWNGKRFFYPISFASGWKNRCDFFSSGFSVFSSYLFFFMFFVSLFEKIERTWKWFSSWFLPRFWAEESMWFIFFWFEFLFIFFYVFPCSSLRFFFSSFAFWIDLRKEKSDFSS